MLNIVALNGRLVREVELKVTTSGKKVVNFTVAVQRSHDKEQADFISCVAWNHTAEYLSKYSKKGSLFIMQYQSVNFISSRLLFQSF